MMTEHRLPPHSLRGVIHRLTRSPRAAGTVTGILVGASSVVPVRRWPRPLHRGVLWGFPLAMAGMSAAALRHVSSADGHSGDHAPAEGSAAAVLSPQARVAIGLGPAVLIHLATRVSYWVDDAVEVGLRRLRVPAPRLVYAAGAGLITGLQVTYDMRQRERSGACEPSAENIWD